MSKKKYYWLKLKDDFFSDKRIKKLRRVAGGDTHTIIYLKMQLLSLKNDGFLVIDGIEESIHEEIALEIDEDPNNVQLTLMFLIQHGLVEEAQDNKLAMIETMQNIGRESESANRVRNYRERQKALQCNVTEVTCNTEKEKEKEKEKDINKDKQEELLPKENINKEIIEYLNFKANRKYLVNAKEANRLINILLKRGYKKEDFFKVIDVKVDHWLGNGDKDRLLKPKTLFAESNFEEYLTQTPYRLINKDKKPVTAAPKINTINQYDLFNAGEE